VKNLRAAKAKLRPVKQKAVARITAANLRAAKAKLRPPKRKQIAALPKNILKSSKFNKMVEQTWKSAGAIGNAGFQNAWNKARAKVIEKIKNRLARNLPAFTPSPPKPKAKTPSPPKPKARQFELRIESRLGPCEDSRTKQRSVRVRERGVRESRVPQEPCVPAPDQHQGASVQGGHCQKDFLGIS
jgi:hypothetical protein